MICSVQDLYENAPSVQNNGITQKQVDIFEIESLRFLFGGKGGGDVVRYVLANKTCTTEPPAQIPSDNAFGGKLTDPVTICTYGNLTSLINGDYPWIGLIAILSNMICLKLISTGIMISRATTDVKGTHESGNLDVKIKVAVNQMAILIRDNCATLHWWLNQPGNNPLGLIIHNVTQPVPYAVNESGKPGFMYSGVFGRGIY